MAFTLASTAFLRWRLSRTIRFLGRRSPVWIISSRSSAIRMVSGKHLKPAYESAHTETLSCISLQPDHVPLSGWTYWKRKLRVCNRAHTSTFCYRLLCKFVENLLLNHITATTTRLYHSNSWTSCIAQIRIRRCCNASKHYKLSSEGLQWPDICRVIPFSSLPPFQASLLRERKG